MYLTNQHNFKQDVIEKMTISEDPALIKDNNDCNKIFLTPNKKYVQGDCKYI